MKSINFTKVLFVDDTVGFIWGAQMKFEVYPSNQFDVAHAENAKVLNLREPERKSPEPEPHATFSGVVRSY